MSAASAQPAGRKRGQVVPSPRSRNKVAIIGFTQHGYQAPWTDEAWDLWGLNDLHSTLEEQCPGIFKTTRVSWFQVHRRDFEGKYPGARDPEHQTWLTKQTCPIYLWETDPRIPSSVAYPVREVLSMTHPVTGNRLCPEAYFNNSISWMLALAIYQGYTTIGLFGVDMAMDGVHGESEYGHQRPSVEFWIGIARGLGIEVVMPEVSEILKTGYLYGYDNGTHLRKKFVARLTDLEVSERQNVDAYEITKRLLFQIKGALMLLTSDGVTSDVLKEAVGTMTPAARQAAVDTLRADEVAISSDHQSAANAMHEVRGAMNNCKWALTNYIPGDGALSDVPRIEHATDAALLAASDGNTAPVPGAVNRIMNLVPES